MRPGEPRAGEHALLTEGTVVDSPFDRPTPPDGVPIAAPADRTSPSDVDLALPAELMNRTDVERFRGRLQELRSDFVDDPERAVRDAQRLLGEAMEALGDAVAERGRVLGERATGGDTEEMRLALRRYRSALDRLLAV